MKACVIGDGGWGTALATILDANGHDVSVWGPFAHQLDEVRERRENKTFLPGVPLSGEIQWVADREAAVAGSEIVVLAVPSRFVRDVLHGFQDCLPKQAAVVSVAKGLDKDTHQRMSEVAAEKLQRPSIAALSGPSHAEEVARGVPSAVVIACEDHGHRNLLQEAFNRPTFRVYTSDDVIGVELGGALKNIIAIAAGVSDGIGFGDNTKAALITRGLAEMTRLGVALGARASTFSGLSGIGDLIVTCASRLSRNRGVGERLGKGERIVDILAGMAQVAEGVWNCATAVALAQKLDVDVPISEEVNAVVHGGKDPRQAVQDLLTREPRPEQDRAH
jgi:glycerol-3-phosphate dehydrogenase (NAD(P)+)